MKTEDHKLANIRIRQTEGPVIVVKRRDHVVDGIVTGIIADLLRFPLLLGGLALGLWMMGLAILGLKPSGPPCPHS